MKSTPLRPRRGDTALFPTVLRHATTAALTLLLGSSALPLAHAQTNADAFARDSGFVASNGIAAQVDDKIITLDQLRQQISPIIPEIRRRSATREQFEQNVSLVTREVLQNLIDQILIVKEFDEKGYVLPETFIRNEMDDYITKNFNGDRSRFLSSLRQQGTNEMAFRNRMRDGIIVNYMRSQTLRSGTQVSPEQINSYYQQHRSQFYEEAGVKLSMIILQANADSDRTLVQQQVAAIEKELADGAAFADLAKKYSQGPNAAEGGDWGWRRYSDLRDELSQLAQELKAGEHSKPLTLDNATYILFVEEKRDSGVKDLDTVRAEIEQAIVGQLARQSQQRWLERLRRQAYIRYYLQEAGPSPVVDNSPVAMRLGQQEQEEKQADKQPEPLLPQGLPQIPANTPKQLEQKPKQPMINTEVGTMPQYNPATGKFDDTPRIRATTGTTGDN